MENEHIGDRLWLEPSANDPKHRGSIIDFAATRCPCNDPRCAGIVVAIQSVSDIDTMTVTQTTARRMIEVLQMALKEYSNGNDESLKESLRRRYHLP